MLAQNDKWGALFLLCYADKPLKLSVWQELLTKFSSDIQFEGINVYSETVKHKDNKDGTYQIATGKWKGRFSTNKPYLQVVKAIFRKKNGSSITIKDIGHLREDFRKYAKKNIPVRVDYQGLDYYPYKDPFKVDKKLPAWPSKPFDWTPIGLVAIAVGGIIVYAKAQR